MAPLTTHRPPGEGELALTPFERHLRDIFYGKDSQTCQAMENAVLELLADFPARRANRKVESFLPPPSNYQRSLHASLRRRQREAAAQP